jgi:tetrahydromethanopterin S-methyltransferase subunit F
MEPPQEPGLQQQIDDLVALVTKGRTDIDHLTSRANDSDARADVHGRRITANRADIDGLEAQVALSREMIVELQADGVVSRDHTAQLEQALTSSRTIGAAIGILMASRDVDQDEALRLLRQASSRSNTPMRALAEVIVADRRSLV